MGLTSQQQLPDQKKDQIKWSFKTLFDNFSPIAKMFSTPVSICLLLSVIFIGTAELLGRDVPIYFYLLSLVMLLLASAEKQDTKNKKTN